MSQRHPFFTLGMNKLSADLLNRGVDMLRHHEANRYRVAMKHPMPRRRQVRGFGGVSMRPIRLVGATPIAPGTINQWTYAFAFVKLDEDGLTYIADEGETLDDYLFARNMTEAGNDGVYPEGHGLEAPAGTVITMRPIAVGSVVPSWPVTIGDGIVMQFAADNPIDVECAP